MIDLVKMCLLALAVIPATAQGQNATPCLDGRRTSVEVTAVVDGRGFVLADSREARLVSLEIPPAGAETVARDALARLIAGQRIAVIAADQPDRYGRLVVRGAVLDGAARSVEETLLAQGGGRCRNRAGQELPRGAAGG
jgi:endonuclease YncB( thermonuclease family)